MTLSFCSCQQHGTQRGKVQICNTTVVSNCCTPASKLVGGRRNVCVLISRTRSVVLSPVAGLRKTFKMLLCHSHHPADTKTIGDHAKTQRPERLTEGHLHLSPLGERVKFPARIRCVGCGQR